MDRMTLLLFGKMPREVGNPYRFRVESTEQMEKFIQENNSVKDCFVSVYPANCLVDKIFFDFDYGNSVLEDTKKVYEYLLNKKYSVIPVASGRKGYHLYLLIKPKFYGSETKLLLTKTAYSIILDVFGEFKVDKIQIPNKDRRRLILRTPERIIAPDPKVIGDIRRLCRIPGTARPPDNYSYCTYLPSDEFLDMTEKEVIEYTKNPYHNGADISYDNAPLLTDFKYEFKEAKVDFTDWIPLGDSLVEFPSNPNLFLETVLRPCLYNNIARIHPDHDARVASTYDLLLAGYLPSFIFNSYSTLGWEDWDDQKALSQIKSCETDIKEKKYERYCCTKLRNLKMPIYGCCVG